MKRLNVFICLISQVQFCDGCTVCVAGNEMSAVKKGLCPRSFVFHLKVCVSNMHSVSHVFPFLK